MGAQQSASSADAGAAGSASVAKTCYYELLGVERDATEDEIKKAYRRKALELHPDRNLNDVESATRRFAEIQSAHEILSDPQERAWYDSHRDAILNGSDDIGSGVDPATFRNVRLTTTEEIMGLMRKFNATIPFTDETNGFYGIARETFEHLALEEEAAAEFADVDARDYPTFGSSDDDYDTVVKPFYSTWAGFSTTKSFSWKDKYRLSEAPDRRVRRLMEKENKKLRDDAIRDFNDAVRFLVTFVRKRDPRYTPNNQTEADRQKAIRDAAAKQAARSRAANIKEAAEYKLPDWVQQESASPNEAFSDESEESEENDVEILECVICDKTFKSDKQLEAHERSKKHQKAVQQVRRHMKKEGKELNLDEDAKASKTTDGGVKNTEKYAEQDNGQVSDIETEEVAAAKVATPEAGADHPQATKASSGSASVEGESEDGEYASRETVEARLAHDLHLDDKVEPSDSDNRGADTPATRDSADEAPVGKKVGKARAKREKKAAAGKEAAEVHRCTMCYNTFASRTKLFDHIRDEGHAAAIPRDASAGKKKKR